MLNPHDFFLRTNHIASYEKCPIKSNVTNLPSYCCFVSRSQQTTHSSLILEDLFYWIDYLERKQVWLLDWIQTLKIFQVSWTAQLLPNSTLNVSSGWYWKVHPMSLLWWCVASSSCACLVGTRLLLLLWSYNFSHALTTTVTQPVTDVCVCPCVCVLHS